MRKGVSTPKGEAVATDYRQQPSDQMKTKSYSLDYQAPAREYDNNGWLLAEYDVRLVLNKYDISADIIVGGSRLHR